MTILTQEQIEEDQKEAPMDSVGFDPETIDGKGEDQDASN